MATKPASDGAVQDTGELEQIVGIGPAIAARLAAAGITTLDQLAARSPDELAAHGGHAHEDWIAQARALIQQRKARPLSRRRGTPAAIPSQRYALFKVKLLFAPDGEVQRTIVTHMPTESNEEFERQWDGWDGERLTEFVVGRAGLRPPAPPSAEQPEAPTEPSPARKTPPAPVVELVRGTIEPRPLGGAEGRWPSLPAGQPFEVHLDLDLGAAVARVGHPLQCVATVLARPMEAEQRETLGVAQGKTGDGERMALSIPASPLPVGIYKLYAQIRLERPDGAPPTEAIEEQLRSCLVVMA